MMSEAAAVDRSVAPEVAVDGSRAEARSSSRKWWIGAAIGLSTVLGAAVWYRSMLGRESTDDAQVDAEVVSVPAMAGGTIAHVHFVENQRVKAGDLLATLNDEGLGARLAQAEAQLASARAAAAAADADARVAEATAKGNKPAADAVSSATAADALASTRQLDEARAACASADATLRQVQLDTERSRKLHHDGAISQATLEQSETTLSIAQSNAEAAHARLQAFRSTRAGASGRAAEASARAHQVSDVESFVALARARAAAAQAQVATAEAARALAALDFSYARIVAPQDGTASKKTIAEGQAVSAGQPIVQLVTPGVWVTANFKETQIDELRPGEAVVIHVDAFSSHEIAGQVESLSGGTGSRFTLLPPDNATGNYTKVVQRIPVRIRVTDVPAGIDLRPGLSATVTVFTRTRGGSHVPNR